MAKFEVGDRVVVNMEASENYWGMLGTVAGEEIEETYRVDMDFVPDPKRRLSLENFKGWRFSGHMLERIDPDVPELKATISLLDEWEDVVESAYSMADTLDNLGYAETSESLRANGDSMLHISSALRAALEADGVKLPDQTES